MLTDPNLVHTLQQIITQQITTDRQMSDLQTHVARIEKIQSSLSQFCHVLQGRIDEVESKLKAIAMETDQPEGEIW